MVVFWLLEGDSEMPKASVLTLGEKRGERLTLN